MHEDLSSYHRPLTDLFAPPRTADDWARYRLSGEQIDFYRAKGYVAGVRVLTGEQVEVLRRELSALVTAR